MRTKVSQLFTVSHSPRLVPGYSKFNQATTKTDLKPIERAAITNCIRIVQRVYQPCGGKALVTKNLDWEPKAICTNVSRLPGLSGRNESLLKSISRLAMLNWYFSYSLTLVRAKRVAFLLLAL